MKTDFWTKVKSPTKEMYFVADVFLTVQYLEVLPVYYSLALVYNEGLYAEMYSLSLAVSS